MGSVFHGWRRKVGLLTLAMALMFMGGWGRSLSILDLFSVPDGSGMVWYITLDNGFVVCCRDVDSDLERPQWEAYPIDAVGSFKLDNYDDLRYRWLGFGIIKYPDHSIGETDEMDFWKVWFISYWSIVVPLTLLSAYLLLSKPRKVKSKSEVSAEEPS